MENGEYIDLMPHSRPIREALSKALLCKGSELDIFGFDYADSGSFFRLEHWIMFAGIFRTPRLAVAGTWFESEECVAAATQLPGKSKEPEMENGEYVGAGGSYKALQPLGIGLACPGAVVAFVRNICICDHWVKYTTAAAIPRKAVVGTLLDLEFKL